jgi:hypothetical protein
MSKLLVFDSSEISVWAYPDRKMIHHEMKAYCHGHVLQEALIKGVEAMELHRATKWLSDDRLNGALPPDGAAWAANVWFPRTKAAGWQHWAVVQPVKILGQMNLARFVKKYADLGINARMFSDPDEAMTWLDNA